MAPLVLQFPSGDMTSRWPTIPQKTNKQFTMQQLKIDTTILTPFDVNILEKAVAFSHPTHQKNNVEQSIR